MNNKEIKLEQPAVLVNGKTMVPVRFIGEALGALVNWDQDSRTVIITTKEELHDDKANLRFAVVQNNMYGYMDALGKMVIEPQFDDAYEFVDGLAPVQIDDKWGYIDLNGKIKIEPIYEWAFEFSEGLAIVQNSDDKRGYINTKGEVVIPLQYDNASDFSDGIAAVEVDGLGGYINKQGQYIIQPRYFKSASFSENLAAVATSLSDSVSYIDKTGKEVIKGNFGLWSGEFHEGLAAVEMDGSGESR